MSENMTRWGVGPKLTVLTLVYCVPVVALRLTYPTRFDMDFTPYWALATAGTALLVVGLPFLLAGAAAMNRAFNAGKLCTRGAFALCRHPIYAAWIIFLIPGLSLLLNSWIGLTVPPVMYVLLHVLIRKEEEYLERKFGEEYRAYKKRVPAVLPLGWMRAGK